MYRLIIFLLVAVSLLSAQDTLHPTLRIGYQSHDQTAAEESIATAITLSATHASSWWQSGIEFQAVLGKESAEFEGVPFLDQSQGSFLALRQLYLDYGSESLHLRIGRQAVESPFADSDDVGMSPNRFEAIRLYGAKHAWRYEAGWLYSWSGVDAPRQRRFTPLNGKRGIFYGGARYTPDEAFGVEVWYYGGAQALDALYLASDMTAHYGGVTLNAAWQGAYLDMPERAVSKVWGAQASLTHERSGLGVRLAYNRVLGSQADNLFGGGPYFANMEHNTLTEAGINGSVGVATLSWDAKRSGIEGLSLSASLDRRFGEASRIAEYDIAINYEHDVHWQFSAVYSDVKLPVSFRNLRLFLNIGF